MSDFIRPGLRVYLGPEAIEPSGTHAVFYTRREDGPFYRWEFDEVTSHWRSSRLGHNRIPRTLRTAHGKVPFDLKSELLSHYQEF